MDDILNEHFNRVEKALTTLVDSIAAYNPATQAAVDLVAADDQLSEGLDQRTPTTLVFLPRSGLLTRCSRQTPSKPRPHPDPTRRRRRP